MRQKASSKVIQKRCYNVFCRESKSLNMSLARAKGACARASDSVFGFIRRFEKKQSLNAPLMIKYLVLNYYDLAETFTEHELGDLITLGRDNLIASRRHLNSKQFTIKELLGCYRDDSNRCTVFGNFVIGGPNEKITSCTWSFVLFKPSNGTIIGITKVPYNSHEVYEGYTINGKRIYRSSHIRGIRISRRIQEGEVEEMTRFSPTGSDWLPSNDYLSKTYGDTIEIKVRLDWNTKRLTIYYRENLLVAQRLDTNYYSFDYNADDTLWKMVTVIPSWRYGEGGAIKLQDFSSE